MEQPLVFSIPQANPDGDLLSVQILQEGSTEENASHHHDTGFVMWPSAVILARWITMHPEIVVQQEQHEGDILELGAGCGLVGLTAATLLQNHEQAQEESKNREKVESLEMDSSSNNNTNIIFTDYNPACLENIEKNIHLNNLDDRCSVAGLDFFDQAPEDESNETPTPSSWVDMDGNQQPQVRLVLATDVLCYSNDADLVASTLQAALVEGGQAILVGPNKDRRFGVEEFPEACQKLGLEVAASNHKGISSFDSTNDLSDYEVDQERIQSDLDQTSGYGEGYEFTMFTVDKPIISL